jgi:UDP-N-acetylmuramoylalanine--D-glutamate ligase
MTELKGKRVTVLGLGRSGIAVSKLLISKGAVVFGSDAGHPDVSIKGLNFEKGKHTERIFESELIVVSPGIPQNHPILEEARQRGIEIVGEIELASMIFEGRLIAVTGTNGKTTTCALINEMLKEGGYNTGLGGNISPGIPLSEAIMNSGEDVIMVAEVSTFQLETVKDFKPFIGIVTNISPDHLDRHKDFETYVQLKRKLFVNQDSNDYCILNYDQDITRETEKGVKSKVYFFSTKEAIENGTYLSDDIVYYNNQKESIMLFRKSDVLLEGMHNLENVLAASTASLLVGCDRDSIKRTVKSFTGVPHRLEFVREIRGIKFINNSMCTNPVAFKRSIESLNTPFVLICGGRNKNLELENMVKPITKASYTVVIGECAQSLALYLQKLNYNRFTIAETMDKATELAYEHASRGDTVILSPGGSSFDMFKNFEDRGNCFKESVGRLNNGKI